MLKKNKILIYNSLLYTEAPIHVSEAYVQGDSNPFMSYKTFNRCVKRMSEKGVVELVKKNYGRGGGVRDLIIKIDYLKVLNLIKGVE